MSDYVITFNVYEFKGNCLVGVTTADAKVETHGDGVPLSMFVQIEEQMKQKFGDQSVVLFEAIAPESEARDAD